MEIVFDSSTLILLAKIDLLREVSEGVRVIIPERVERECTKVDTFDSRLILSLIEGGGIRVNKAVNREFVIRLSRDFRLHEGEAEAIGLALERECPVAVDDLPAIRACRILNCRFATAVHFLIDAAEKERIDRLTALSKLEKLALYGRYGRRIIDDATGRLKGGV